MPFKNMMSGRVVTFQMLLHDETGVLASILNIFTQHNANIMTINSIIPSNGSGIVTISAETMDMTEPLEDLLRVLRQLKGVVKAEILAG